MLLRSLLITDDNSTLNGEICDIRIENGFITAIEASLTAEEGEQVHEFPAGTRVSPGFVDLGAYLGEPGHEEREDINSLRRQAQAGGYTQVITLPNTAPVRQTVTDVAYLLRKNGQGAVDLYPLVTLSKDAAGRDMVEMLDLHTAGAIGFTDGPAKRVSGSLLKRTLEYAKVKVDEINVMMSPYDPALVPDGQIHEGAVSTRLGLRGIPKMSETIPLKRAMEVLEYTDGSLMVHLLSSAEGVAEVRRAKKAGLMILATVSAHHLMFTVEALSGFDPNYKMLPPLREESDRQALIEGVKDGTIDVIVSNHLARHGEEKDLEFSYADFGALGLDTAFRQALAALKEHLSVEEIVDKFVHTGALTQAHVVIGTDQPARLTLFTEAGESEYTEADLKGLTKNHPLLGRTLPGKILGVINNGAYHAN